MLRNCGGASNGFDARTWRCLLKPAVVSDIGGLTSERKLPDNHCLSGQAVDHRMLADAPDIKLCLPGPIFGANGILLHCTLLLCNFLLLATFLCLRGSGSRLPLHLLRYTDKRKSEMWITCRYEEIIALLLSSDMKLLSMYQGFISFEGRRVAMRSRRTYCICRYAC